jgi:N utilization substance protein B
VAGRRRARRQAIEICYQADVLGEHPMEVLETWEGTGRKVSPFARELVAGVAEHREELDRLIASHSEGWSLARMPSVDRTILRVACYELLHRPDVPPAVAIDEAVEAVKELSTEDSGRFVNGVLGAIARELAGTERGPSSTSS